MVANIDFKKVFIDVLISEQVNMFCQQECVAREETRAIMIANGYLLFPDVVERSDLYVHPDSDIARNFLNDHTAMETPTMPGTATVG